MAVRQELAGATSSCALPLSVPHNQTLNRLRSLTYSVCALPLDRRALPKRTGQSAHVRPQGSKWEPALVMLKSMGPVRPDQLRGNAYAYALRIGAGHAGFSGSVGVDRIESTAKVSRSRPSGPCLECCLNHWAQVFLHSRGRGMRPGHGLGGGPGDERRSKAPLNCP